MRKMLTFAVVAGLMAVPALAENPYLQPNGTWIVLSGTVQSVQPDAFVLNYDDGVITVEMDDGDRDADAYSLLEGDEVTVSGMIDDDFFETTTIEAGTVYVKKLGTTFHASAVDEEDMMFLHSFEVHPSMTAFTGTVSEVRDEEFMLDTGLRKLTVEVEEMPYDPLDDEGYLRIHEGDRVSVTGSMDFDLFEGREFVATSVTVLDHPGHKATSSE